MISLPELGVPATEEQGHDIAPKRGNSTLVLLAACCSTFVGFGSLLIYSFSIFVKPLSEAFGWSRSEVSLAYSVTALMIALSSPILGRLLDRFPARRVIVPCMVIYAATFASMSLLTAHLWHFLLLFAVMGAVGNGTCQLAYARVLSTWFDRGRGRAFAAMMAGSGLGSIVFPPVTQYLVSHYGWRSTYALLGLCILIIGLPPAILFVYEREGAISTERRGRSSHSVAWKNALTYPFFCLVSALMLFSIAENGLGGHLSPLLTDHGFSAQAAAGVIALLGAATLVSKLTTGYLMDKFSATKAVAALFLLTASGIVMLLYSSSLLIPSTAAVLVGAGFGAESDVVPFLLSRYFGLEAFSELYGYTWSAYALAAAIGPLLMGQLFDCTHSYAYGMIGLAAAAGAAAVFLLLLPRYEASKQHA